MRSVPAGRAGGQGFRLVISRRAILAAPFVPLAMRAAEKKPHVALVIAPGWRGVEAPWSDGAGVSAPNLARFAEGAVVFPHAYACDPATDPARSAILTGRYPHVNGVLTDGSALRAEEVTLDAVLRLGGYTVVNPIDVKAPSPFFVNVTLDAGRFASADASKIHLRENVPANLQEKARKDLAERYGAWAAMDQQFGKILASLEAAGVANDTIVVFTSDHGEQIGSHGLEGAGVAYEESTRVLLAIRFPRVMKGSASDVVASQVDILPTVLGLCGEPPFEGIQGHDLSPLLLGGTGDRPESVYGEGKIGSKDEWRMVVVGSDKLVVDADGAVTQLFNLASDPFEKKNLAGDPLTELKRAELLAMLRAQKSGLLDFKRR